jgi:uncharacterized integral membrane protein
MTDSERKDGEHDTGSGRQLGSIIAVGAVVAAFILLVVQNSEKRQVEWLFWSGDFPLWIVIVASGAAGAILTLFVGYLRRRRKT